MMKTLVAITATLAILAFAPLATGTRSEVGAAVLGVGAHGRSGATGQSGPTGTTRPAGPVPSCPTSPCAVVSETTAMQVKVGTLYSPLTIPRDGTIVGWTIILSRPTASQIAFFDTHEGGRPEAGLAILKHTTGLGYELAARSPFVQLQSYLGEKTQFALSTTIPVQRGERIALTVPTWAPALAIELGPHTLWRASRPRSTCTSAAEASTQTAQTTIGSLVQYSCLYQTAQVLFSATLISTP